MISKRRVKKLLSVGIITSTIFSVGITMSSIIYADDVRNERNVESEEVPIISKDGVRLYVIDGKIYEIPEDMKNPTSEEIRLIQQERGRVTNAVKLIKKAYKKIPKKARKLISRYLGIDQLLQTVEYYTGGLEDTIYKICRRFGMPKSAAWFVAKSIVLVI